MADYKDLVNDRQKYREHIMSGHVTNFPTGRPIGEDHNLPHIAAIAAGKNHWDPQYNSIFEVTFSVPGPISNLISKNDLWILRQQVTNVSGLDALNKTTTAGSQKFFGVDVSYLNPTLDQTYAELQITLNLNLRNVTDNFVLKIFRAWSNLSYDLQDGTRGIKQDYIADYLAIAEANRNGDVWRSYRFNDVMLTGVDGLDSLDYSSNEAAKLNVHFRSDYWYDTFSGSVGTNGTNVGSTVSSYDDLKFTKQTSTQTGTGA